jgi:hypothetical protein
VFPSGHPSKCSTSTVLLNILCCWLSSVGGARGVTIGRQKIVTGMKAGGIRRIIGRRWA